MCGRAVRVKRVRTRLLRRCAEHAGALARSSFGSARAAKRWARRAFHEFDASPLRREATLARIALDAVRLTRLAKALTGARDGRRRFADALLQACVNVDSRGVRHRSAPLRSYVDVSVQAKAL